MPAEANDPGAIYMLANYRSHGLLGLQQDLAKGVELWTQAAKLGYSKAYFSLEHEYNQQGHVKKAKFHHEAAAMAGHEVSRFTHGAMEGASASGNLERAVKHLTIAACDGHYHAIHTLSTFSEQGFIVSRESFDSTLGSEARDACICAITRPI